MTVDDLCAIARNFDGRTLCTARGARFVVRMEGDLPCFTPESTGIGRRLSRADASGSVARYSVTGSIRRGDYQVGGHSTAIARPLRWATLVVFEA